MALISKAIPPVSREFAEELQRRFRPYEPEPGFDRDELMVSVGEQRVIKWILHQSRGYAMKSTLETSTIDNTIEDIKPISVDRLVTIKEERKPTLFEMFTNRFGN